MAPQASERQSWFLRRDEVDVWSASLQAPTATCDRLWRLLSEDEQARACRYRAPEHQSRFMVGRGLLRVLIASYLQTAPEALSFTYSAHGKPALVSAIWDDSLCFNVAHSEDVALFAFTRSRAVGVDVERVRAELADQRTAEQTFSDYESAVLRSLPEPERTRAFFRCWAQKEAYVKARGEGLNIPLRDFDVVVAPGEPAALLASREDEAAAGRWRMFDLAVQPGYAAALAVDGDVRKVNDQTWTWDRGGYGQRERRGVTE